MQDISCLSLLHLSFCFNHFFILSCIVSPKYLFSNISNQHLPTYQLAIHPSCVRPLIDPFTYRPYFYSTPYVCILMSIHPLNNSYQSVRAFIHSTNPLTFHPYIHPFPTHSLILQPINLAYTQPFTSPTIRLSIHSINHLVFINPHFQPSFNCHSMYASIPSTNCSSSHRSICPTSN